MILLNVLVLIFEVLYYSMFMYFAKGEGKFWKYVLLFSLATLIIGFVGTNNLFAYLIFIILSLYGFKYIVKIKTGIFDMLCIFIILLLKLLIEIPLYFLFINIFSIYYLGIITGLIKIFIIIVLRNKIRTLYKILQKLWNKNNFYIRYIFSTIMFIYCILSCLFIILYYL